ncbi:hypothetical protein BC940DRAFT_312166 [Gongronella butleri]|nr:hypothetical protein BC940DRAFT_312166 [Gongronella butleri]
MDVVLVAQWPCLLSSLSPFPRILEEKIRRWQGRRVKRGTPGAHTRTRAHAHTRTYPVNESPLGFLSEVLLAPKRQQGSRQMHLVTRCHASSHLVNSFFAVLLAKKTLAQFTRGVKMAFLAKTPKKCVFGCPVPNLHLLIRRSHLYIYPCVCQFHDQRQ